MGWLRRADRAGWPRLDPAGSGAGVPSSGEGWVLQEPRAAGAAVLRGGSAGGVVVAVHVRPGVRPGLLPGLGVQRAALAGCLWLFLGCGGGGSLPFFDGRAPSVASR